MNKLSEQALCSKITLEWIKERGFLQVTKGDPRDWQDTKNGLILSDEFGWKASGFIDEDVTVEFLVNSPEEYDACLKRFINMRILAELGQI